MKVLVTCPPMLKAIDKFRPQFADKGIEVVAPDVTATMSEDELCEILPEFDGWIIGDDPATRKVFTAGKTGNLKAAVKWGIGVDNVDFDACKDLEIPISNTPGMFGNEVADVAVGYLLTLARHLGDVDKKVRNGDWYKPPGMSLTGKTVGIVGHGDIGRAVYRRLTGFDMNLVVFDPYAKKLEAGATIATWPEKLETLDFLVFTCALTNENRHMFNANIKSAIKPGLKVINVARGPLIDETFLIECVASGVVSAVGLDVFEEEPMLPNHPLKEKENCIFGSHNGSNTVEGVERASNKAMQLLFEYLGV